MFPTILSFTTLTLLASLSIAEAFPVLSRSQSAQALTGRTARGFEIPLQRRKTTNNDLTKRQGVHSGSIDLGNNADLIYTVPIELGNTVTAVHLDTGSSDLWVISDACTTGTCSTASVPKLPSASLNTSNGASVVMRYGDSQTGTQASGPVAFDTATIAGLSMTEQPFVAVNATTSDIVRFGSAGIFGLGFPSGSSIQKAVANQNSANGRATPDELHDLSYKDGPLLARISSTGELERTMFSISLQRNTIDIGGGAGTLTVGKLPDGTDPNQVTWVPVRLYSEAEGGAAPPTFAPNEQYPFRWEIDIEGVFLNGERLADSTIPATGGVDSTRVSALVDTGNSLLRGPSDVVGNIFSQLAPNFDIASLAQSRAPVVPCNTPINLSFQIGGKMFPIDPRDMIGQLRDGDTTNCVADNLVTTDAPGKGALFRWSLGDPFFRSNLVAFHYGNLTHPSVDPPMIGLLSNVPQDANNQLQQAVSDAQANGGIFETTLELAPTAEAAAQGQITLTHSRALPTATAAGGAQSTDSVGSTNNAGISENETSSSNSAYAMARTTLAYLFAPLLVLLCSA